MASMLNRLGRFSYRRRWLVVAVWLLALGGAVMLAVASDGPVNTRATIPGIESQQAFDLIEERFPGAATDGGQSRGSLRAHRHLVRR